MRKLLKIRCLVMILLLLLTCALFAEPAATALPPTINSLSQQDALFNQNGPQQIQAREQLTQRQYQLSEQIQQTTNPRLRFELLEQRLEILNTLAVDARLNQQLKEHARWQQAIRSDAWKLRQSESPPQRITGEYWTLLCDLSDMGKLAQDMDSTQRACIQRLKQFLDKQTRNTEANEPQVMALIQQVRLGLLQLYDQRGNSSQACKLINQLKQQDPENQALHDDLKQTYGYCHLIGTRFNTRLITTDGQIWDSREKRGTPIILYFWAGPPAPGTPAPGSSKSVLSANNPQSSEPLWNQLLKVKAQVLLVDLSYADESGLQIPASPWPTYRQEPGQFKLTDYFHVKTLPRIVVIDKKGMIQAIGGPATNSLLKNLSPD